MSILFTLDPGIVCAGSAVFGDGLLLGANFHSVKTRKKDPRSHVERASLMVREIVRHHGPILEMCEEFLCEWPQVYAGSSVDPNRLLPLTGVCTGVASYARQATIDSVLPRTWGAPGKPKRKRDEYVVAKVCHAILSPAEKQNICDDPTWDTWDAIAVGLWKLERLKWRRRYPGT